MLTQAIFAVANAHQADKGIIAMVMAKVEHPPCVIKHTFGHGKTRNRKLAKNPARILTLFALGNLFLMRCRLMA